MHIGVVFPQVEIGMDPGAIRDYAQAVEAMGYTHILTFDHVLDGVVLGRTALDPQARLVEVVANVVSERVLPRGCVDTQLQPLRRSTGTTRRGRLPANVIEFRPRRA